MTDFDEQIEHIRDSIEMATDVINETKDQVKGLEEELVNVIREKDQAAAKAEWKATQERGRIWREENPEEAAVFLEKIKARNRIQLAALAEAHGWDLDETGENPLPPWDVHKLSDFAEIPKPLMAHVMAAAGIFPSVSQARKNGWADPLVVGEFIVTKKKIRIKVIDTDTKS